MSEQASEPKLLTALARKANLSEAAYYDAIKEMCRCENVNDAHFSALLMLAHQHDLNPLLGHLHLMRTKHGVKVVTGVDGYMVFLLRAEADGLVVRHEYEEGWFPDTRQQPDIRLQPDGSVRVTYLKLRRGGRVRIWKKGDPDDRPRLHTEWFDEVVRSTDPWAMTSRMLEHKAYSQGIRRHLGFYVADEDEVGRIDDAPVTVEPRRPLQPALDVAPLVAPAPQAIGTADGQPIIAQPLRASSEYRTERAYSAPDGSTVTWSTVGNPDVPFVTERKKRTKKTKEGQPAAAGPVGSQPAAAPPESSSVASSTAGATSDAGSSGVADSRTASADPGGATPSPAAPTTQEIVEREKRNAQIRDDLEMRDQLMRIAGDATDPRRLRAKNLADALGRADAETWRSKSRACLKAPKVATLSEPAHIGAAAPAAAPPPGPTEAPSVPSAPIPDAPKRERKKRGTDAPPAPAEAAEPDWSKDDSLKLDEELIAKQQRMFDDIE